MKLYISIPITGHDYEAQREKALSEKVFFQNLGYEVVTPFDIVSDPNTDYATSMGMCVKELLGSDFVYFCEGWENSKGCTAERELSKIYDKKIWMFDYLPFQLHKENVEEFVRDCNELINEWDYANQNSGDFHSVGNKMRNALSNFPKKYFGIAE